MEPMHMYNKPKPLAKNKPRVKEKPIALINALRSAGVISKGPDHKENHTEDYVQDVIIFPDAHKEVFGAKKAVGDTNKHPGNKNIQTCLTMCNASSSTNDNLQQGENHTEDYVQDVIIFPDAHNEVSGKKKAVGDTNKHSGNKNIQTFLPMSKALSSTNDDIQKGKNHSEDVMEDVIIFPDVHNEVSGAKKALGDISKHSGNNSIRAYLTMNKASTSTEDDLQPETNESFDYVEDTLTDSESPYDVIDYTKFDSDIVDTMDGSDVESLDESTYSNISECMCSSTVSNTSTSSSSSTPAGPSFFTYTVDGVHKCLKACNMETFAEHCRAHSLDGKFFKELDLNIFLDFPFELSKFNVMKLTSIIHKGWRPNN